MVLVRNLDFLTVNMCKQESISVGCVPSALHCTVGGLPDRDSPDRDPPRQRPPGQRSLRQRPLRQRPPGMNMGPETETPPRRNMGQGNQTGSDTIQRHPCEQTNKCKNSTLPKLRLRAVINLIILCQM